VVGVIDGLIDSRQATDAVSIAGFALSAVLEALEQADDSDGWIGGSAHELADAHARACVAAPVDPVELAGWLAGFVLGDGQMLGDFDAGAYDDALGGHGWAEYRRLITQAWQKNPSGWHEKYLMQELLRSAGEVDALVAIYAAELLPSGYTHLMIAQEFDEVGRADEALEWAERGLREAAGSLDARLVDYLAARYGATGAFGKALAARQNAFDAGRTLASYRDLRDAAGKAEQWESVRECALQQLRSDAAASAAQSRAGFGWGEGPVWISALIDDGDVGAAWDAAAGVASDRQWLTLADLISSDRPADALPVYLRAIEPLRSQTGDPVYQQFAACLARSSTATSSWAPRRSLPLTERRCAPIRNASAT
jgi:tetratricopeptide (TPR) repeat protein